MRSNWCCAFLMAIAGVSPVVADDPTTRPTVPGLSGLAAVLSDQRDRPVRTMPYLSDAAAYRLPEVDPPRAEALPVLEAIAKDSDTPAIERVAALMMLGSVDREERREGILEWFKRIYSWIYPYHVHPAEWFVSGFPRYGETEHLRIKGWSLREGDQYPPKINSSDLAILAKWALAGEFKQPHEHWPRTHRAMATISVGLTDDSRALDVLLSCPPIWIGDAGEMRDAVLHGLNLLCRNPSRRDELAAWLKEHKKPNAHRYRAILALAYHQDERVIEPLCDLVLQLHVGDYLIRARTQPAEQIDPVTEYLQAETPYILRLCGEYEDSRPSEAVLAYVYSGGHSTDAAMRAVRDSTVKPDKHKLLGALSMPLKAWEMRPIQDVLAGILVPEDMGKVVQLLDRRHWREQDFYGHVLWIHRLPQELLVPPLRTVLEEIAREHPNGAVQGWAREALEVFNARSAEDE